MTNTPCFYYFPRQQDGDNPAGITVSKTPKLPDGDFQIDEYVWPDLALWFIAEQNFTEDERQQAYRDSLLLLLEDV